MVWGDAAISSYGNFRSASTETAGEGSQPDNRGSAKNNHPPTRRRRPAASLMGQAHATDSTSRAGTVWLLKGCKQQSSPGCARPETVPRRTEVSPWAPRSADKTAFRRTLKACHHLWIQGCKKNVREILLTQVEPEMRSRYAGRITLTCSSG